MRISVEPEALRSLSRQLEQSGEQIRQMTASLSQALGSLTGEVSFPQSLLNEWQVAHRQGEQIFAMLTDMGRRIQSKATDFQTADQQHHPIMDGTVYFGNPVSLYQTAAVSGNSSILPGYSGTDTAISNPLSAIHAVYAEAASDQGGTAGWGNLGASSSAGLATLGVGAVAAGAVAKTGLGLNMRNNVPHGGTKSSRSPHVPSDNNVGVRYTLNHAARNPQVWKFVDPAKKNHSMNENNVDRMDAGLVFDTGASKSSGRFNSVVTDISIHGRSQIYGLQDEAAETFKIVSDAVKAVSHGASQLADQVKEKLSSLNIRLA